MILQALRGPFGVSLLKSQIDLLEMADDLRERDTLA
jgi:hypothetical protein